MGLTFNKYGDHYDVSCCNKRVAQIIYKYDYWYLKLECELNHIYVKEIADFMNQLATDLCTYRRIP